jgi:hypothetical protein
VGPGRAQRLLAFVFGLQGQTLRFGYRADKSLPCLVLCAFTGLRFLARDIANLP